MGSVLQFSMTLFARQERTGKRRLGYLGPTARVPARPRSGPSRPSRRRSFQRRSDNLFRDCIVPPTPGIWIRLVGLLRTRFVDRYFIRMKFHRARIKKSLTLFTAEANFISIIFGNLETQRGSFGWFI